MWGDVQEEGKNNTAEITQGMAKLSTGNGGNATAYGSGLHPNESTSTVEVKDSENPNSLYSSVADFEALGLKKELLQGVYAMGFSKPSKIQEVALPIILANPPKHLIAQAQSGTGKTAAFALGMLSRVDENEKYPQALCICPARELACQIGDVIKAMGKFTKIETLLAVKQTQLRGQITQHIIVGTPGKVLDLIKHRNFDPKKIKIFVLDEADEMLDQQGLGDQSLRIHSFLNPAQCQMLLFSATYEKGVGSFAERVVPRPHSSIRVKREELSLDAIAQYYIDCGDERGKFEVLSELYGHLTVGQTIIFVQRRDTARDLQARMTQEGHKVALLYGSEMSPEERDKVMNSFRSGESKVLITTNVLSRGIDVLQVSLVINYDVPKDGENRPDFATYLHRIGRSGRFGRQGIAINFVHDRYSVETLKEIEQYFGKKIQELPRNQLDSLDRMLSELK